MLTKPDPFRHIQDSQLQVQVDDQVHLLEVVPCDRPPHISSPHGTSQLRDHPLPDAPSISPQPLTHLNVDALFFTKPITGSDHLLTDAAKPLCHPTWGRSVRGGIEQWGSRPSAQPSDGTVTVRDGRCRPGHGISNSSRRIRARRAFNTLQVRSYPRFTLYCRPLILALLRLQGDTLGETTETTPS